MGNRVWDLRSAVAALRSVDEKRKVIKLDGRLTLGTGGAVDYLKKHHGFRVI